jgi:hypothetical protein
MAANPKVPCILKTNREEHLMIGLRFFLALEVDEITSLAQNAICLAAK